MSLVSGVGDGVTFSSGDGVGFGVGVGLRVSPGFNVTGISMSGSSVASGVAGSADASGVCAVFVSLSRIVLPTSSTPGATVSFPLFCVGLI